MSGRDPEPSCLICGVLARHTTLTRHGIAYLCHYCEDKTDDVLIGPGVPYSSDLRETAENVQG